MKKRSYGARAGGKENQWVIRAIDDYEADSPTWDESELENQRITKLTIAREITGSPSTTLNKLNDRS